MAKKKRKIQNKPNYPTGVHYAESDGEFKLFKKYGRDNIVREPYYITEDLEELIEEIERSCRRWKCSVNLKDLKQFINQNNTGAQ